MDFSWFSGLSGLCIKKLKKDIYTSWLLCSQNLVCLFVRLHGSSLGPGSFCSSELDHQRATRSFSSSVNLTQGSLMSSYRLFPTCRVSRAQLLMSSLNRISLVHWVSRMEIFPLFISMNVLKVSLKPANYILISFCAQLQHFGHVGARQTNCFRSQKS